MLTIAIARLYNTTPQNITMHIRNIYANGELDELSTCKDFLQVQADVKRQIKRKKKHYNFKIILAIDYRVCSNVGIHFRNWAFAILEEYSRKGFSMNDDRLKNPKPCGEDYFDELLDHCYTISVLYLKKLPTVLDLPSAISSPVLYPSCSYKRKMPEQLSPGTFFSLQLLPVIL